MDEFHGVLLLGQKPVQQNKQRPIVLVFGDDFFGVFNEKGYAVLGDQLYVFGQPVCAQEVACYEAEYLQFQIDNQWGISFYHFEKNDQRWKNYVKTFLDFNRYWLLASHFVPLKL